MLDFEMCVIANKSNQNHIAMLSNPNAFGCMSNARRVRVALRPRPDRPRNINDPSHLSNYDVIDYRDREGGG